MSDSELTEIGADVVFRAGGVLDIFWGYTGCHLLECHLSRVFVPLEDCHIRDSHIYNLFSGQWEGTLIQELVVAARCMLHCHYDFSAAAN